MPEKRGKILVIRGGALGDFILTLPAISALRETFPQTHLELLGYPNVAALARSAGIIDASRSIEARPLARFFARNASLDDDWAAYFESFNLIISYLYDPDDIFKTNVGRASKAQFIQGPHRPSENEPTHATAIFLKPLEHLAIYNANPVPALPIAAPNLDGRWLAVHPGSGSEKKNWPLDKWQELLTRFVSQTDRNLLLIAGEAESDRVQRLAATLPANRLRLAQNLPLTEIAPLLASADAFIGHDSGITHLAAALGLTTLILWGPSNDLIWRPLHPAVEILKDTAGLDHLPVEKVFQAAQQLIQR